MPFNIASAPDGTIWFTEPNVNKLGHVDASGVPLKDVSLNEFQKVSRLDKMAQSGLLHGLLYPVCSEGETSNISHQMA